MKISGLAVLLLLLAPGAALAQTSPGAASLGTAPGLLPPGSVLAPRIARCTIGAVDTVGMSFVCSNRAGSRTYWIGRATRFRLGSAHTTGFALATGAPVEVRFHHRGPLAIADSVVQRP